MPSVVDEEGAFLDVLARVGPPSPWHGCLRFLMMAILSRFGRRTWLGLGLGLVLGLG